MKSLKIIRVGALLILVIIVTLATKNFAQQILYMGELAFGAEGLSGDELIYVTLDAKNGYTRWFTTPPDYEPPPRIPTFDCDHYSEFGLGSGIFTAFDAPNDATNPSHAVAWDWYSITIEVPTRDFDEIFDLDLRDANWIRGEEVYRDTEI